MFCGISTRLSFGRIGVTALFARIAGALVLAARVPGIVLFVLAAVATLRLIGALLLGPAVQRVIPLVRLMTLLGSFLILFTFLG